jgi:hypothetical protein
MGEKILEEVTVYFPYTVIYVSDTIKTKKFSIYA